MYPAPLDSSLLPGSLPFRPLLHPPFSLLSQEKTTGFIHWKGRSGSEALVTSHEFLKGYFGSKCGRRYMPAQGASDPTPPPVGTSTHSRCQSGLGGAHSCNTTVGKRRGRASSRGQTRWRSGDQGTWAPLVEPGKEGAGKKLGAGRGYC